MIDIANQRRIVHNLWGTRVQVTCCGKPYDWRTNGGKTLQHAAALATYERVEDVRLMVPCFGTDLVGPERRLDWKDEDAVRFYIAKCDGVYVLPGEAAFIASADCPTIVVEVLDDPHAGIWVLHGGRDCLIDRGALNGGSARKHFSVVDALFAQELVQGHRPERIRAYIMLGIKRFPHPRDHPKHGKYNRRMLKYAANRWGETCVIPDDCLVLHEVIRGQFAEYGVEEVGTDDIDTLSTTWPCSETATFHSAHAGNEKRNAVLTVNRNH